MTVPLEERADGVLYGLAIGDALGMPTQMLSRERVATLFPELSWFEAGPAENQISAGQPAARVTDDTEQALIVARLLVDGRGHVDPGRFVAALRAWAEEAERNGSEQLGPSSRRALEAVQSGTPIREAGQRGSTDGAAMRIPPIGLVVPVNELTTLVDRVEEACLATHHTGLAIAGAAAVAAAVSAGLEGRSYPEAIAVARVAADLGLRRGGYVAGPNLARRIAWAVALVAGRPEGEALDLIAELVGTGVATEQAVPAAFALVALAPHDPWHGCLCAARLGGDADTIAEIAGAIGGAQAGIHGFPAEAVSQVEEVNHLDLARVSRQLLELRAGRHS